jgi:hypothetical protein
MAQFFEHIMCSINNSELRIALEQLFAIMGVGKGSQAGDPGLVGNITGNVTGDVLGDVTGDVKSDSGANIITSGATPELSTFTGDVVSGSIREFARKTYLADDDVDLTFNYHVLDGSSASVALGITNPPHGRLMFFSAWDVSNACTLTLGTGDFDGSGGNVVTFDNAESFIVVWAVHGTRFAIIVNGDCTIS